MTIGAAHVWTIDAAPDAARACTFLDCLSGEERVRAARLRSTNLRLRFITAHGAMRRILSQYLGGAPSAIPVETTAAGKPFVAGATLAFSLAYSDDVVVCAVAADGQIGVDVERIRAMPDADDLAREYFAAAEARAYAEVPVLDRPAAFFSVWTRKEALVKAVGDSSTVPLDAFEVDISPSSPQPQISGAVTGGQWRLWSFDPAPGYAAALACGPAIAAVERYHFDDASLRLVQQLALGARS